MDIDQTKKELILEDDFIDKYNLDLNIINLIKSNKLNDKKNTEIVNKNKNTVDLRNIINNKQINNFNILISKTNNINNLYPDINKELVKKAFNLINTNFDI